MKTGGQYPAGWSAEGSSGSFYFPGFPSNDILSRGYELQRPVKKSTGGEQGTEMRLSPAITRNTRRLPYAVAALAASEDGDRLSSGRKSPMQKYE